MKTAAYRGPARQAILLTLLFGFAFLIGGPISEEWAMAMAQAWPTTVFPNVEMVAKGLKYAFFATAILLYLNELWKLVRAKRSS